jgi:diguanylate cyclase (GGDEF)-like protein
MPRRKPNPKPQYKDPVTQMMAMLLPIHSALTLDWLVDATATAAERTLNAAHTFFYVEDGDGKLEYKAPASDLRRRSVQRAIDAFGRDTLSGTIDPSSAPVIMEALDSHAAVTAPAGELLQGVVATSAATTAQRELGIDSVSVVPLESAGERLGALVLLLVGQPDGDHVRLLAEHVACATVNLRQVVASRDAGVIDVVRSVFDARKIESDLQRELARSERYKRAVSIAVVEATNLRLLQERFGEFLTNRLLQRLGEGLARNARDIDVIGAYRDSGYTMILTEATPEGAERAAARLLAVAQSTTLDSDHVPGLELHLAAGWATSPLDGVSTESMFAAAQRRMYEEASAVA